MRISLRILFYFFTAWVSLNISFAQSYPETLKKIKATGTIKIGHRDASLPFSYLDDNKKPIGYAVDLCLKVVDEIKNELGISNLRVEYVLVSSANRISGLKDGRIDMECGSTTNNVERQKEVAFSLTYFMTGTRMIVRKSSGISNYEDLKDKTVAVVTGSAPEAVIKAYSQENSLGIKFVQSAGLADAFRAVESGTADAFPMDDILLYSLKVNAKVPSDFEVVGDFLTDDPYAIMMRKDDPEFKKVVDAALRKVYLTGEINRIYPRWFQLSIPPNGVNLGVPMSESIRRLFKRPNDKGAEACGRLLC